MKQMANNWETITDTLGTVRSGLVEQGFTSDQAFWLVQDLVRRPDAPVFIAK